MGLQEAGGAEEHHQGQLEGQGCAQDAPDPAPGHPGLALRIVRGRLERPGLGLRGRGLELYRALLALAAKFTPGYQIGTRAGRKIREKWYKPWRRVALRRADAGLDAALDAGGGAHDELSALRLERPELGLGLFDAAPELGQDLVVGAGCQLGLEGPGEPAESRQPALALAELLLAAAVRDAAVGERAALEAEQARGQGVAEARAMGRVAAVVGGLKAGVLLLEGRLALNRSTCAWQRLMR